jgi:organic hydroperoxide reductase OsmC/OhrA
MSTYQVTVRWTGNRGEGTADYAAYDRTHEIAAPRRPPIGGSADPSFRGDPTRYNPEDLLVAALSACHMLSYLHLCAISGIVVTAYVDDAVGTMTHGEDGGRFTEVVLRPTVTVRSGAARGSADADDASLRDRARALHERAHHQCFIANSVNFPVHCEPRISADAEAEHG